MKTTKRKKRQATEFLFDACPICDSSKLVYREEEEKFPYGPDGKDQVFLSAIVPVQRCRDCDFATTGTEAEIRRHVAVCRHLRRLSPDEIIEIRAELNMSQESFGDITGIGRSSLIRWENGQILQNKANDQLIYLLQFTDNLERLMQRVSDDDDSQRSFPLPIFRTQPESKILEMKESPFELRRLAA